ncbi:MAG TPA: amidohydrolase [Candidatus Limnocylindria bacterium]|nr:amidohydrolase [Candidatus Limnocylindria bacterium]
MKGRAQLIVEGRIATLAGDEGFGWVEALAVWEELVLVAGSLAEVEALAGPGTRRWRLPPDTVAMPGITDAHLHLMMLVLTQTQVDLSPADDLVGTLELVGRAHAERLAEGDSDGWLLGHGWSLDRLGRWPDTADLERVAPRRPVALYAHDHHSRWVSAEALRLAGVTDLSGDPPGGMIRRADDGQPTGILHEIASSLVDEVIPDPTDGELEVGLGRVAGDLAALGITGAHDPGELSGDRAISRGPTFYSRLAAQGRLPLRVHASVRAPQLDRAIELGLRSGQGVDEDDSSDPLLARLAGRYRMGWLKLFTDGSLGSRSAAMLEPYSDALQRPPTGGPRGMFLASREALAEDLRRASAAGIVGQLHAIGDAGVRLALDLLAGLPDGGLMRRVEHAQLVDPADMPRFAASGMAASVQPVHLRSDAGPAREAWGERSRHAFPLAALAGAGALIPFGTDAPVEPVDPWPGIAVAIARRDPYRPSDEPLGAEHAISLARAIRAACLDPALSAREERLGRLLPGYRADLLIVPAEGLREPVDPAALASTRPLATLIDGELVFRQSSFEPG